MGALEDCFANLDQPIREALADLPNAQKKSLGVLMLAEDRCQSSWLTAKCISAASEAAGVALKPNQVAPALRHAVSLVATRRRQGATEYRIMLQGRRVVEGALSRSALSVVYVEAGKPRTARQHLATLLESLTGDVRISDPYYGQRTLDSLALLSSAKSVRLLTARTNEKQAVVGHAVADFRKEHPNIEIRTAPDPSTMHDRYIVTDDSLILVGHGLKDIGGKESFVIRLDRDLASGLIADLRASFDTKWSNAIPISVSIYWSNVSQALSNMLVR